MIAFGGSSGGSSGGYGSSGVATGYYAGSMGSAGSTPVYSSYAPAFGTDTVNGSLYGVPTLYQGAPGTVIDPGYYSPAEGVPSPNDTSSPSESSPSPQPVNDGSTGLDARGPSLETVLKVRLPEESRFYVNGRPTTTEGAEREFVAKRLVPGQTYTFKVKAVLEKDGQTIERDQIVSLRGGDHHEIAFDFSEPRQAITSVAIHAPENAKIILAGTPANRGGETRVFSTRRLKSGETWEDYKVVAIIEKDGETITQEKSLTIVGGENHEINFDFENSDVRVASR